MTGRATDQINYRYIRCSMVKRIFTISNAAEKSTTIYTDFNDGHFEIYISFATKNAQKTAKLNPSTLHY